MIARGNKEMDNFGIKLSRGAVKAFTLNSIKDLDWQKENEEVKSLHLQERFQKERVIW